MPPDAADVRAPEAPAATAVAGHLDPVSLKRTACRVRWSNVLAVIGGPLQVAGMAFDWFTQERGPQFADPAWGPSVSGTLALPALFLALFGGPAFLVLWELAGRRQGARRARLITALQWVRWLVVVLAVVNCGIAVYATAGTLQDEWMIYPGWCGTFVAQLLTGLSMAIVPSRQAGDPRLLGDGSWRVRGSMRVLEVAAMVAVGVLAMALVVVVPRVPQARQVVQEVPDGTGAAVADVREAPGRESDGGGVGLEGTDESGTQVWRTSWRGVKSLHMIQYHGGERALVLLDQASPRRPRMVLIDANDGSVVRSFDERAVAALGLGLDVPDVDLTDFSVHGDTLVFDGVAEEWLGKGGVGKWVGEDAASKQSNATIQRDVDGLHGRELTSDGKWFVGTGQLCGRQVARVADGTWVSNGDVVVVAQACNRTEVEAEGPVYYVGPEGGDATVLPDTAMLLGVNATDGSLAWSADLQLAADWVHAQDDPRGIVEAGRAPWTFTHSGDHATVAMDGHELTFDPLTGK